MRTYTIIYFSIVTIVCTLIFACVSRVTENKRHIIVNNNNDPNKVTF